jgi:hypothetical protein
VPHGWWRQLRSYLERGATIINSVNFPDSQLPFHAKYRLGYCQPQCTPSWSAKISTLLGKRGKTISPIMLNKLCGEICLQSYQYRTALSEAKLERIAQD